MAVTLGKNSRPAGGQAKGDVVMATDDPQNNRGSLKTAENDPSRAGAPVNMASVVETIEVNGEVPQARFGHTITIVSKSKVVLFGGATGDTGKYSMTGETYIYNILNKSWQKLQGKKHPTMKFLTAISVSEGSPALAPCCPLFNQRGADADGSLRRSHWR